MSRRWLFWPTPAGVNPVNFDGTNDYLTLTGGLSGAVDDKKWTCSVWFRRTGGEGNDQRLISDSSGRYIIQFFTDNTIRIAAGNPSFVQTLLATITGAITGTDWHHLLFSVDLASPSNRFAYLDGVLQTPTWTTYDDALIDFTGGNQGFGAASGGTAKFVGDVADFQMWDGVFVDLSQQANRELFIVDGAPVDPAVAAASLGDPIVLLSGETDTWHTNDGTGGGFTEVGALTDGTGPVEL